MKNSKWIGLAAAAVIIACCYATWLYVPTVKLYIGGMSATGKHNFGRPGVMHIFLCALAIINFMLPFIWSKRTNIFLSGFNIAWCFRNYLLLSRCYGGECPILQPAFYIIALAAVVMLAMSFVPDVKIVEKAK